MHGAAGGGGQNKAQGSRPGLYSVRPAGAAARPAVDLHARAA